MKDINNIPKLINVKQVSDGWIKKYELEYRVEGSEETIIYETVSRKGIEEYKKEIFNGTSEDDAICIVPYISNNKIVMIKQFRYALNDWSLEFPGGLVEKGEQASKTAVRELEEETGYKPYINGLGEFEINEFPHSGYSSVGILSELVKIVFVHVDEKNIVKQNLEKTEYIKIVTINISDINDILNDNKIKIGSRTQLILYDILKHNGIKFIS